MATARGFIGAGEVFLNKKVAGVAQGITGPYYANKFEVTPKVKKLPLISRARADYGQAVISVSVHEPAVFTIELSENSREAMVGALMVCDRRDKLNASSLKMSRVAILVFLLVSLVS